MEEGFEINEKPDDNSDDLMSTQKVHPKTGIEKILDRCTPMFDAEMGVRLHYARRKMKLRQVDLAKLLSVPQKVISHLETGKNPSVEFSALRFKSVLGKHWRYVMFGAGKENYEQFRHATINKFGRVVLHS